MIRSLFGLFLLTLAASDAFAQAPRISAIGSKMPGCQFGTDAGFDFIEWNHDGKLDLFFDDGSIHSGNIHVNVGTHAEPKFGHKLYYPLKVKGSIAPA